MDRAMQSQSIVKQLDALTGAQFAYVSRNPVTWASASHIATRTANGLEIALKQPARVRREVLTLELAQDKQRYARQLVRTIIDQQ